MSITQIPFQDPAPPAEKPQPQQLGLYDVRGVATDDRDEDAHIPHLLIQLQDDLSRSRKREAAWISIIVHLLLVIIVVNSDWIGAYLDKRFHWHPFVILEARNPTAGKDITILALPPDAQKVSQKPRTPVISDKNRIAMTRHPELDPKELQKILATPPPGRPGVPGPRASQAPQAMAQSQPSGPQPQPGQAQSPRPQFQSTQTAQLQAPPRSNVFNKYGGSMSAGSAIQQAAQAAAAHRGGGGQGGDLGLGTAAHGRAYGNFQILSDTLGVDFFPYLERIRIAIQNHWYEVLPPSVFPPISKKGKLLIQFTIRKDGSIDINRMGVAASSGDEALDRAAWGGILASNPLPPLPQEYIRLGGKDLTIRGMFFYNLSESELQ